MTHEVFQNISKIIERDSKSTTYKFALLRGVIDIIQENSPYINFIGDRVQIPTGLLIEKWLLYYYPILESQTTIPQINGNLKLAFEVQFVELIKNYEARGGFSVFYNDLKNKGIPKDLQSDFLEITKKLRNTITTMPMKYIGRSISDDFYSIFNYENTKIKKTNHLDIEQLINDYGTFSIPFQYYEAFKVLGSFINGQDSILFKWAEFSVNASGKNLSVNKVLSKVLESPIRKRDVTASKSLYHKILEKEGNVYCVWTGRKINDLTDMNIDHVIPFSIWKNNDLWNLLPALTKVNGQKKDKIPSPEIIARQKNHILDYWQIVHEHQSNRFQKEMQVALLGNHSFDNWRKKGIEQLQNRCSYLIENRGFEEWNI
jgi:hypothetical protein